MVPNSKDWLIIWQDSLDLNTLEISERKKLRLFSYQYFRTGTTTKVPTPLPKDWLLS